MKGELLLWKERTVLDNPPSEETKLKMVEFLMKTMVPRILAARKADEEVKKKIGELDGEVIYIQV
ncbi:hypothetical protein [Bacillus mycoides]|uniref:hypothetical protein n=1 Tax=Bacillus mycoides TaxID=1405 RepID=UPI000278D452|nr:hypothetical protein [Bacillus mycoides]EJQ61743.1 hypothetical protein IEY_04228 [Bacillus mycoides]EJQ64621.1 hypothetical protein IEW_01105 [Bacillus mycoides]EJV71489.1 hypothetical protein IEU_01106 [Bacillus mycoides]MDR4299652.1 hypothetical protein [Bacillus mycoides]